MGSLPARLLSVFTKTGRSLNSFAMLREKKNALAVAVLFLRVKGLRSCGMVKREPGVKV